MFFCGFDTPFGPGCLVEDESMLHRVFLPSSHATATERMYTAYPDAAYRSGRFTDCLAAKLSALSNGAYSEIKTDVLFFGNTTPFALKVLSALSTIPRGQTVSYGQLAEKAGFPLAARAAGNVLAANPFPLIIPCHRVVRSDGSPGCYQGGKPMKLFLLKEENDSAVS